MKRFRNRAEAGRMLADAVKRLNLDHPVVYALPRGGAPAGAEIARALGAPLDLVFVRKLGAPGHGELAIGAVVDGATPQTVLNDEIISALGVSRAQIEDLRRAALAEIARRRAAFDDALSPVDPRGRSAVIVDDGVATGATMEASVMALKSAGAARVIVAAPVMPLEAAAHFRKIADDVVCLETPVPFLAVGAHYDDFRQLEDRDVIELLSAMNADDEFSRKRRDRH